MVSNAPQSSTTPTKARCVLDDATPHARFPGARSPQRCPMPGSPRRATRGRPRRPRKPADQRAVAKAGAAASATRSPSPTSVLRRLDQHTPRNPDESATRCGQLRSPDRVAGAWLLRRLICAIVRTSYEPAIACVANQQSDAPQKKQRSVGSVVGALVLAAQHDGLASAWAVCFPRLWLVVVRVRFKAFRGRRSSHPGHRVEARAMTL